MRCDATANIVDHSTSVGLPASLGDCKQWARLQADSLQCLWRDLIILSWHVHHLGLLTFSDCDCLIELRHRSLRHDLLSFLGFWGAAFALFTFTVRLAKLQDKTASESVLCEAQAQGCLEVKPQQPHSTHLTVASKMKVPIRDMVGDAQPQSSLDTLQP